MIVARGYFGVHLTNPRDPTNVGSALRACGCFGAAFLSYSGKRYRRHAADTQKAYRHMPLFHTSEEPGALHVPYDCVPVAVELVPGATQLPHFVHPERALYVFGPEDGSISPDLLDICRGGALRIPSLFCLNLAAAVNVVLYDRVAKAGLNRTLYAHGKALEAAE